MICFFHYFCTQKYVYGKDALQQLDAWKKRADRKPLIVRGARQVGKTWLVKEFAKRSFKKSVYVNFEEDDILRDVFVPDFDIQRILYAIGLRKRTFIDKETLLIPNASLKPKPDSLWVFEKHFSKNLVE